MKYKYEPTEEEEKKKLLWDMEFRKVLGLNKSFKMFAIKALIEAMIADRENDMIAYYESERDVKVEGANDKQTKESK